MLRSNRFIRAIGLLICLWGSTLIHAQQSNPQGAGNVQKSKTGSFREVSRRASALASLDKQREFPLLNSAGEIAGRIRGEIIDGAKKFLVIPQTGAPAMVDPLTYVVISQSGNRIIAYGDDIDRHTVSRVYIKIFSAGGDLIKLLDEDLWSPFALALSSEGEVWIAAKKGYQGRRFVIVRYDASGNPLAENSLPAEIPMRLVLATDNQHAALVLYNEEQHTRSVQVLDNTGAPLFQKTFDETYHGVEFISDQKFVVYSGSRWMLFDINNADAPISKGMLKGNALGNHPVSGFPGGDKFILVTHVENGYRVQTINSRSGQTIAENVYAGTPYWQPYRFSRAINSDTIEMLVDTEIVELKINEQNE